MIMNGFYITKDSSNLVKMNKQEYLESLNKDDLFSIIKYGLRESTSPSDVTVEDIYYVIQCNPL